MTQSSLVRLVSWNVNGIRACHKNGFMNWWESSNFDAIALQEVRALPEQIPADLISRNGWSKHWFAAEKKGYSGVGLLLKSEPKQVWQGMGVAEFDSEGRVIGAELKDLVFVSAYFPNSQDKGARIAYKIRFCDAINEWCKKISKKTGKPVVLAGDYNIAHQAIDLARPKENEGTAGYLPEEREWMTKFLGSGWIDTFRHLYPEKTEAYSWWSARQNARPRNIGWRIDYHALPKGTESLIQEAAIHPDVMGSDHCPVSVALKF